MSTSTTPVFPRSLGSSPLGSPHLTLTPSLQSSFEENFSESETEEVNETVNLDCPNLCPFCLVIFKNKDYHRRHKCIFRPDASFFRNQNITPVILKLPRKYQETLVILNQLCSEDVVEMCRLQNWCLPHYYPFFFPHQFRSGHLGHWNPTSLYIGW